MTFKTARFAPGIVTRLRLVLGAIILVAFTSYVAVFVQLSTQNRAIQRLMQPALPLFVSTQEIQYGLQDLMISLQDVDLVTSLSELDELEDRFATLLLELQSKGRIVDQVNQQDASSGGMQPALSKIKEDVMNIFASKRLLIKSDALAAEQWAEFQSVQSGMRETLEDMAVGLAALLEPKLLGKTPGQAGALDGVLQQYAQQLLTANALTELTISLESFVEALGVLMTITDPVDLDQQAVSAQQKSREIAGLIALVPEGPERNELAEGLIALRGLFFAEGGIVTGMSDRIQEKMHLEALSLDGRDPIQTISDLSKAAAGIARKSAEMTNERIAASVSRLEWIVTLTWIVKLIIISATIVLVVERQINRRMSRLTKAVTEIANGNTDYVVDVDGPDEIGNMARALETFKLNARELHRSNIELEKFAYAAAHDLRSPLLAIRDLVEWIPEDEDTVLGAESRQHLDMLRQRVARLNRLLSDLLQYARVGKEAGDAGDVDLATLVNDLKEMLNAGETFDVVYAGPSISARTYQTPLRQVLMNLIGNAIKHHDRRAGKIVVQAREDCGRLHVNVTDDGPGIEPRYHERIFELFRTLKSRDAVEGSGLGLAIIRKQIEHFHGNIRIHSDPEKGRGTVFDFDMPLLGAAGPAGDRTTFPNEKK